MVPSLLCCVSPASADSLTHTHTTHTLYTRHKCKPCNYIYVTLANMQQPGGSSNPGLHCSIRSAVYTFCGIPERVLTVGRALTGFHNHKKNKNNERFQSWQLMFTWIFSMQEAGMQPVSPELQREPSHQCLLLLSRIKKLSPAAKCIELGSADRKAQRDRYMLVLYV